METSDQMGFHKGFSQRFWQTSRPPVCSVGGQNQFMHPPSAENLCLSMLEMQWTALRTEIA
jgi:hypothetical protein